MSDDRILELLTERMERALTDAERAELERLLQANPQWHRHDVDVAAAALQLALEQPVEMPDDVKARLIGRLVGDGMAATSALGPRSAEGGDGPTAARSGPRSLSSPRERTPVPAQRGAPSGGSASGSGRATAAPLARSSAPARRGPAASLSAAAAAVAVVVAVIGWWPRLAPAGGDDVVAARAALAAAPDAVKVAWTRTDDPLGKTVDGDVVWSTATQTGYMRFRGLPGNDPMAAQYQLWIFDKQRDERFPVDGGVFDIDARTVTAAGDVIVPIRARLPVREVTLFAVTLERPGGVVVSTRERLVTLAKVG